MSFFQDNAEIFSNLENLIEKVGYHPWKNMHDWFIAEGSKNKEIQEHKDAGALYRLAWLCVVSSTSEGYPTQKDIEQLVRVYIECYKKYIEYYHDNNRMNVITSTLNEEGKLSKIQTFDTEIDRKFSKELMGRFISLECSYTWVTRYIIYMINEVLQISENEQYRNLVSRCNFAKEQENLYNWIKSIFHNIDIHPLRKGKPGYDMAKFILNNNYNFLNLSLEYKFGSRELYSVPIINSPEGIRIASFRGGLYKLYLPLLNAIDTYAIRNGITYRKGDIFESVVQKIIASLMPESSIISNNLLSCKKYFNGNNGNHDLDALYIDKDIIIIVECKAKDSPNDPYNAYTQVFGEDGFQKIKKQLEIHEKSIYDKDKIVLEYLNDKKTVDPSSKTIIKIGIVLDPVAGCVYRDGIHILHIEGLVQVMYFIKSSRSLIEYLEFRASYIEKWDVMDEMDIIVPFWQSKMEGSYIVVPENESVELPVYNKNFWIYYLCNNKFETSQMMTNKPLNIFSLIDSNIRNRVMFEGDNYIVTGL